MIRLLVLLFLLSPHLLAKKLTEESVFNDPKGTQPTRGVPVIVQVPVGAKAEMPVVKEMKVKNIKLRSAVMMVERLTACSYLVTPHAVSFRPKVTSPGRFEKSVSAGDAFKCGYMNKELNTYINHRPQFMPKPAFKRRMEPNPSWHNRT